MIAVVLIIQNTRKRVLTSREEERRVISDLQLSLIGNHPDPHFILNDLKSVPHPVERSDRDKISDSLRIISGLYRDMPLSAGNPRRPLGEGIGFCHEYHAREFGGIIEIIVG